ncbi:hypothetical protein [Sandarakinorhabdus sp.]|nr:hypothetical protein [Sandarakinorhabdus sp.]
MWTRRKPPPPGPDGDRPPTGMETTIIHLAGWSLLVTAVLWALIA